MNACPVFEIPRSSKVKMTEAIVTYIHHNCFFLELGGGVMLFDVPGSDYRPDGAEELIRRKLEGADATVFFSHSHPDHCSSDIVALTRAVRNVRYVFSFDVPELIPELDIEGAVIIEPGEEPARVGDLIVSGLEATDLGVAFLIETPAARIYFGGDLAEWAWPTLDDRAREAELRYFERCLEQIKAFKPDIVFANADPRMPETRGGIDKLVDAVRPPALVPMHLFGETVTLADLEDPLARHGATVFSYRQMGDSLTVRVS